MVGAHPAHSRWTGLVTCRLNRANHCGNCIYPSHSVLVAYLKPPWFTRSVFNRVAMVFGIGQTLTVVRRRSGAPQRIPVVVPEVDGVKYLVSTRGESDWVKNVRAHPRVDLNGVAYVAAEVPTAQRGAVIAAYRPLAGRVVEAYWRDLPDDADHPVFALTPAG